MCRELLGGLLLLLSTMVWGQAGYEYRYWFDNAHGQARTGQSATNAWQMEVPLDGLSLGLHTLHVQVKDTAQAWSAPLTRTFLHAAGASALTGRYWFDEDKGEHLTAPAWAQGAFLLDVSGLTDGLHSVHFQMEGQGAPSCPVTHLFLKIPPTEGVDYLICLATVDDEAFKQERVPSSGGLVNWTLDVSALEPGLHRLQVRVVTPTGAASSVSDHFFFRTTKSDEMAAMKCYYSIDGEATLSQAGSYGNGLFHFDIDVASLDDGLHRIAYFLASETGGSTRLNAAWFMKTPVGGNGITGYDYWLNERTETARRVELPERQTPFDLMTLLPVDHLPLRSSSFQLAMVDGSPRLYAKNDLHVRFYDVAGRFTDMTRSYVDEQVVQEVEETTPLVSGQTLTRTKPGENEIQWFTLEAAVGDSLTFKTSQAASLQLFSPSGQEVYAASGATSVAFGGCHAWEDGTYYLALHDVTGTRGSTIGLDYVHIDKYAVLSHTPSSIGVAQQGFTMKLYGNGYDKLLSAALLLEGEADTLSIAADTCVVESSSDAWLRFNLTGEERYGKYGLLLTFQDSTGVEELLLQEALALVEPVYGVDIAVKNVAKLAMPYPVTIKVKNTGNVPYQMLPLNVAYDNVDNVSDFALQNFGLIMEKEGVEAGLRPDVVTDNLLGKGIKGRMINFMIPELASEEELELTVSFVAAGHTRFNLYVWTDKGWSPTPNSTADCMPDPCEVIAGIVGGQEALSCEEIQTRIDALPDGYLAAKSQSAPEIVCAAGYNAYEEMRDALGMEMDLTERRWLRHPNSILWQLASHYGPGRQAAAAEALIALQKEQAESDCPRPLIYRIEVLVPGDPNDMLGYTSESGSRFISGEVRDVFYTIEFENDPELASASAHTIVVTDTLDASRFDLSTFEPTGVKIGHVHMACDGSPSFLRTMDLRPAIDVIAEVELVYEEAKGIATWTIRSLDPMSMEPSDNPMQGALPINADGNGEGEFTYNIRLKGAFDDGTAINNRASIVFDREDAILTPVWTNIVDTVPPTSKLTGGIVQNDTTLTLTWHGEDNRSGLWKYDLYVQEGTGADATWRKAAESVTDTLCDFRFEDGTSYGFCVLATDSAGNVERKELVREFSLEAFKPGDANGDGKVNALDVTLVVQYYLTKKAVLNFDAADVVRDGVIDALDITRILQIYLKGSSTRIRQRMKQVTYETE